MSVLEYIVLAFALSFPLLILVRDCALKVRIPLTRGLGVSALLSLEHVLLLLAGMRLGNFLRFDIPDYDNLIYLGFIVVVAVRMFAAAMRKKGGEPVSYDISRWGTVALLGVASGLNGLIVGMGLGCRVNAADDVWAASVPLFVILFLMAYLGVMMGRQKKQMRERRWQLVAVLFLLAFAVKGAFFGE